MQLFCDLKQIPPRTKYESWSTTCTATKITVSPPLYSTRLVTCMYLDNIECPTYKLGETTCFFTPTYVGCGPKLGGLIT